MKIRMRSFGLVAVLVLAGCAKPEPPPVASVEEPQPAPSPEPAQHPVGVELRATTATPDDPTARLANCKLRDELQSRIDSLKNELAQLRLSFTDKHPRVIGVKESLDRLVQQGLSECVDKIQTDAPGHI
jgi:hypothetical protein